MRPRHPSTQATAAPAPSIPLPRGLFAQVAQRAVARPATFPGYIAGLFGAMRDGGEFAVTTPPSRTPATRPVAFALLRMLLLKVQGTGGLGSHKDASRSTSSTNLSNLAHVGRP